jgi:hypothetical protein
MFITRRFCFCPAMDSSLSCMISLIVSSVCTFFKASRLFSFRKIHFVHFIVVHLVTSLILDNKKKNLSTHKLISNPLNLLIKILVEKSMHQSASSSNFESTFASKTAHKLIEQWTKQYHLTPKLPWESDHERNWISILQAKPFPWPYFIHRMLFK